VAGNLSRDEAVQRARVLSAESYQVELDLTKGDQFFSSVTVVRFGCDEPGTRTFIDLAATAVHEVTLNGKRLAQPVFDGAADSDRIMLPPLQRRNVLRVTADCAYSRTGEGLHHFTDPVDGRVYLYTHFEPADAHRVYACFDQPDLKATFELTVIAPPGWQVISNTAADISGEPLAAGTRERWHFPPTPVLSPYVTALVAGPYHVARDSVDGIGLGVFCRQSLAEYLDPEEILEITKQGFRFYHRAFGIRYPFGKYDQLFVPEFNAGAMENAGCVTFLEDFVFRSRVTDAARERRAETILHEMAHMWFGDLVTMQWWDDLWLNESFATFASVLCLAEATRWRGAWTTFAQLFKTSAARQDQLSSTHPVCADIPDVHAVEVNFDGITYFKGASVLKQLAAYVGQDTFLAGLRTYFTRHAWGNATLADLLTALSQASGRDLAAWSWEWLQTAGVNTLRPEVAVDTAGTMAAFAVVQEAPDDHPTLRTHRVAIGLYDRGAGNGITRRHRVELDVAGPRTDVPALIGHRRPDLVIVNDDDLDYAKIRLDEHSMRTVVSGIADVTPSLPAALCWAAAWDMCRDGEMPARDYLQLVLSGIESVTNIGVTQTLLRQAAQAIRTYADPAWRQDGLEILADRLYELTHRAPPGSDAQAAHIRELTGVATTAEHLEFLGGLLDGSARVEGLDVDTELRWALLRRLASRGVAGAAEIGAELERDPTAAGQRNAATCRAAIPDPAAKQATWDRLVTAGASRPGQTAGGAGHGHSGAGMTYAVFRATVAGFADPDQEALLAPFAQRYFDAVGDIWDGWAPVMARRFARGAYPATVISERTIAMTEDYIERRLPPTALRRLLTECRDDMARALRAQERDRSAQRSASAAAMRSHSSPSTGGEVAKFSRAKPSQPGPNPGPDESLTFAFARRYGAGSPGRPSARKSSQAR
jgi:aminopeptidase N